MSHLQFLGLRSASNSTFDKFLDCPTLKTLTLGALEYPCTVSVDILRDFMKKIPNLEELHLDKIEIDGSLGDIFDQKNDQLKVVTFGQSFTGEEVKDFVKKCPNLQKVFFKNGKQINSELLDCLAKSCPFLDYLSFLYSSFEFNHHSKISVFSSLNTLILEGCSISDLELGVAIRVCPHLKEINAFGSQEITDNGFMDLADLSPHLVKIDARYTQITHEGLEHLFKKCHSLKVAHFSNEHAYPFILEKWKNLQVADFRNFFTSDEDLMSLADRCPNLRAIRFISPIKVETILYLLDKCPNLRVIFGHLEHSNGSLEKVEKKYELKSLVFPRRGIHPSDLEPIAKLFPKLEKFAIEDMEGDFSLLGNLAKFWPNLHHLYVSGPRYGKDVEALMSFVEHCPLEILDCEVDKETVELLEQLRPGIRIEERFVQFIDIEYLKFPYDFD